MKRTFYNSERDKQSELYNQGFFGNARNRGHWAIVDRKGKKIGEATDVEYILIPEDSKNNMFAPIQQDALDYFKRYNISWWRQEEDGYFPTGHLVSSQNHCINHLFALRKDPNAVKSIIENATGLQFDEVLASLIDSCRVSRVRLHFCITRSFTLLSC